MDGNAKLNEKFNYFVEILLVTALVSRKSCDIIFYQFRVMY